MSKAVVRVSDKAATMLSIESRKTGIPKSRLASTAVRLLLGGRRAKA
jgi:hypothetical protein